MAADGETPSDDGSNDDKGPGPGAGMFLALIGGLLAFALVVVVGAAILAIAFGPDDDEANDTATASSESDDDPSAETGSSAVTDSAVLDAGATVYASSCASCHGQQGEGGAGPEFAGITERIPEVADHIAVVTDGRNAMPAFGASLDQAQIEAVVAYERDVLGAG